MSGASDSIARNRAVQTEWYGEPLGDRFRRLLNQLRLSQSGLAQVLGLSPPMLSQLMSGRRARISNPAILNRLLALEALARDPALGRLTADELSDRLRHIHDDVTTGTYRTRTPPAQPAARVEPTRVEAARVEAAAALLDAHYPDVADLLRACGSLTTLDQREAS